MSIKKKIGKDGKRRWVADFYITEKHGRLKRIVRQFPTKNLAERYEMKSKTEAFEGVYFDRKKVDRVTVKDVWNLYAQKTRRDNKSWKSDVGRSAHIVDILGHIPVATLTEIHVDQYRDTRLNGPTYTGRPPTPTTLDRELELLKRMLNYAARSKEIASNPIAHVKTLGVPNIRDIVLSQTEFEKVFAAAAVSLKPILLVAYETGMRKDEILGLRWERVDLKNQCFRLLGQELKEGKPRIVLLSSRVVAALSELARSIGGYVFINPETGTRWGRVDTLWSRALKGAGISKDVHFHDLRRSFITNARRRGIPESVVMQMSGHKTRAVFDRYNIIDERDLENAMKLLEEGRKCELSATGMY